MASITPFQPTNVGPFQFQPTLDGDLYNAFIGWNMISRRYFISLFTLGGCRVFTLPVIGSTDGVPIQAISWDHGFVTVQTTSRHGYLMGMTVNLTIAGCVPDGYNGDIQALITGLDTFEYPLSADPGVASQFGLSNYDINIVAGYFNSKMVFRQSNQNFEVTP